MSVRRRRQNLSVLTPSVTEISPSGRHSRPAAADAQMRGSRYVAYRRRHPAAASVRDDRSGAAALATGLVLAGPRGRRSPSWS